MLKQRKPENLMAAHLVERGGMLVPDSNDTVDENALLRARTLLAYLNNTNQLQYITKGDAVLVCSDQVTKGMTDILDAVFLPDGVAAYVQYKTFTKIHEQPIFAVYRATPEVHDAFVNVWLKSSLSWLDKNPADRIRLELQYPVTTA